MDSQQNVVFHDKINNWNYYITNLFHQNKVYQYNNLHLLLSKLASIYAHSLSLYNYNNNNTYKQNEQYLFWNNNPLNTFVVSGNIISYHWKYFNNSEYVIFKIDDNSLHHHQHTSTTPHFIINKSALPHTLTNNLHSLKNIKCLVGNPKFQHNELQIIEIIQFNFNLSQQIQFWYRAIDDLFTLDNQVWDLEQQQHRAATHSNNQIYIETLNNNIIKNNLTVLSPYLHPQDHDDMSSIDLSMVSDNLSETEDQPTQQAPAPSLKSLNYNFLDTIYNYHQIVPTATNISITDLYQFNGLNDLLDQYTQAHTKTTISASILKSSLFNNILHNYQSMGLISLYNNNNNCNIKPYLQLLASIIPKCTKWLKLQTKINTINFIQIQQSFKPHIPNLNVETILAMYKVVMNAFTARGKLVQEWYVELDSNVSNHKYALIHIIYV